MSKSNEIEKYMAVYRHEENASHFIPRFLDTKHQYIIFKIYPRLATLNREKTKLGKRRRRFSSIGSEAGRASRFLERAASQREKRREERGKRNPEAKLLRPFLSAEQQPDSSKGEHPVHANDIPEVQRAVFRGYQRRPWRESDSRCFDARANTHVPLPLPSLSLSKCNLCTCTILLYRVFVANRSRLGCKGSRTRGSRGSLRKNRSSVRRCFWNFLFWINKLREGTEDEFEICSKMSFVVIWG